MNTIVEQDIRSITQASLPWDSFSGSRVLVSGAAGFLPAYLVETLLYLNKFLLPKPAHVVAMVRNRERAEARFADYKNRPDLEIVAHDVSQPFLSSDSFDFIVHAASQASPVFYRTDPVGTLSPNVLGTYHLLNSARQGACKGFLYFSSGEVYGNLGDKSTLIVEDRGGFLDPTDLRSCYGESKRMGETMCVAWAQQFNIPTRIARPFHTYGPGMRLDDGRVFADFVRDILNGGPIILRSDGSAHRCFCYLADATLGFFTVLLKGSIGQAYNVSNPEGECSIGTLADRLAHVFKDEGMSVQRLARVGTDYMQSPIVGAMPSIDKLKSLGWQPTRSIEEGFQRTVASYR